jgi:hypothetical protein
LKKEQALTSFIALYQGDTVASSKILAITADPHLVSDFAHRLLDTQSWEPDERTATGLEASRQRWGVPASKDKKRPTAGLEQVGQEGETDDKENSAYGRIIP